MEKTMTQQSAKQFIEKCQKDPQFQKKVSGVKNPSEMETILKESGFNFTKDEYKAAIKSIHGKEYSDAELSKIAGGTPPPAAAFLK